MPPLISQGGHSDVGLVSLRHSFSSSVSREHFAPGPNPAIASRTSAERPSPSTARGGVDGLVDVGFEVSRRIPSAGQAPSSCFLISSGSPGSRHTASTFEERQQRWLRKKMSCVKNDDLVVFRKVATRRATLWMRRWSRPRQDHRISRSCNPSQARLGENPQRQIPFGAPSDRILDGLC